MREHNSARILSATVLVAALGYFVDIYDLVLFSVVRVKSLQGLGVAPEKILEVGVHLLNTQMAGMLVGGIVWGVLGDKRGRLSVLFGSIFLYSVANIANGFATSVPMYAVLRFFAGVGLAGELGAAITLVSEVLPKEKRGYGTTIVATVGVSGALVAAAVAENFTWQMAYITGGALGFVLLLLRLGTFESGMYESIKKLDCKRGDLLLLLRTRARFVKYVHCIFTGMPIWFVLGILITFAPEIAKALNVDGAVTGGKAIMYAYIGLVSGDLGSGLLSQFLRSRKKVLWAFLVLTGAFILLYLNSANISIGYFYFLCVLLGFAIGYWAVFVTMASEQFGTNLRATVTTTVPNFVRGATVPITLSFQMLKQSVGVVNSAMIVGMACVALAVVSLSQLRESYGMDLNFLEEG